MNEHLLMIQLNNIWKDLQETSDCNQAINALNEIDILSAIDYIQSILKLSNTQIEILGKIIYILQFIYNNDGSVNVITDDRYDILYEKYRKSTGQKLTGAKVNVNRKTAKHTYTDLRGTLDKVYWYCEVDAEDDRDTIYDWMKQRERKLNRDIFSVPVKVALLPKWDGVSMIAELDENGVCELALSRGDTEINEALDWSYLFKGIQLEEPLGVKSAVKYEVVINDENFEKAKQTIYPFKTKRSAVSGLLNNQDISRNIMLPLLTLKPLQKQVLGSLPIMHPHMLEDEGLFEYSEISTDYKVLDKLQCDISSLKERINNSGFDYDGIVIRIMDTNLQEELGRENNINNYEVAFKFPAPEAITELSDIDFQYGLLGAITPVAKIQPLFINGKTVTSISLGSMDRFEKLGLRYNDVVKIKYDIIPYLVLESHGSGELIEAPTHCKFCEQPLTKEPVLGCYNVDCVVNTVGKILNYVTKMRIPNIGVAVITEFVECGIFTGIHSLYDLDKHKQTIIDMKGYGVKSYTNMIEAIDSRREVFDYELLGSLGIRSIGRKIFKRISSIYYIDELIEICTKGKLNKLIMEGIKEDTAKKIITGIERNIATIFILRSELNVKAYKDFRPEANENAVYVCFTKVRDKEFEKYLNGKGVVVADSYNKQVDILICKDPNEESSKIKKARKDNKEIISLEQAYQLFKYK